MSKLIPYDPTKHQRTSIGRWQEKTTGKLVSLDPATLPAGEVAPSSPAPAEVQGPARELEAAPLPPVPPVETVTTGGEGSQGEPPRSQAQPSPGPSSQGPSVPSSQASPPPFSPPTIDDAPGAPGAPQGGNPNVPHDPECWKAGTEGRPCPRCMTLIYGSLPEPELLACVKLHESVVNRFAPHPRPFDPEEAAAVGMAFQMMARRYGNPLAEYAPLMMVASSTYGVIQARKEPRPGSQGGA